MSELLVSVSRSLPTIEPVQPTEDPGPIALESTLTLCLDNLSKPLYGKLHPSSCNPTREADIVLTVWYVVLLLAMVVLNGRIVYKLWANMMELKKDSGVVVEELSSLVTTIPEDQMVTVQEEEVITEEVMDEGVAVPKRPAPEPTTPNSKKAKLALKPKLSKGEGKKRAKADGVPKKKKRPSIRRRTPKASRTPVDRRKAQSAYILFSREHRAQVVADNPKDKMTEITSKLGKMWSALPESEKTFWRNAQGPSDAKPKHSKRTPAPPPPDTAPEALDYAAHLKLLGDSITKMGEITGELYEQGDYSDLTVSALLTTLLDCLLCASAPLIYLSSHIDQIKVISEEQQIRTLDNIAFIMPGLENFKS